MKTAIVIPARLGSSRFYGKILANINGRPLILHVLDRVKKCKNVDIIAVATDDEKIVNALKNENVNVFMTDINCKSGTDRIAQVAEKFLQDVDIFINVQGDEPLVSPFLVDRLISELKTDENLNFITAAYPFADEQSAKNPNNVKVVFDKNFYALLFSRSLIPYNRANIDITYFKHLGIYGYKRNFLINFANSAPSKLEQAESLEQLRALENGYKVKIVISDADSIGVDEPSDIEKVEKILRGENL